MAKQNWSSMCKKNKKINIITTSMWILPEKKTHSTTHTLYLKTKTKIPQQADYHETCQVFKSLLVLCSKNSWNKFLASYNPFTLPGPLTIRSAGGASVARQALTFTLGATEALVAFHPAATTIRGRGKRGYNLIAMKWLRDSADVRWIHWLVD